MRYDAGVARPLRTGLYEHVVTNELEDALRSFVTDRVNVSALAPADAPSVLARHLAREVERALRSVRAEDRPAHQARIVNDLLARLGELTNDEALRDEHLAPPPRRLEEIRDVAPLPRPATPLASSTLLTRNRAEPALGQELAREIASADRIDAIVAFVTVGGVRALQEALEAFARRGTAPQTRMRILTTTFTGTTEIGALDRLARLPGVEVRISYDVRRTRLHAKAWLFHRDTGLHTAYVGSANLTHTALGGGHEWMVKVCAADLPHVIEKFEGTFDSLWFDTEFERYDPSSEADRVRLGAALHVERGRAAAPPVLFTLRPLPFQEEILDRLAAERSLHGRMKNLVVAATGTGKTVIAAFDYKRRADAAGLAPRLLFVAHRRELLEQAQSTFRHVLHDGAFGELLADGEEPARWNHVFATIQSAVSRRIWDRLGRDHFRHVIIDECHHAPASDYQKLIPALAPEILVGLTATPERADGKSLLPDFAGHIAAELRLWSALERQLLVPFEYYGISDNTKLQSVRWTRSGYDLGELSKAYTSNKAAEERVDLVFEQLKRRVVDVRAVRALAFCVSIEHAEFMASAFTKQGLPALAVHGKTPAAIREAAPGRLRDREVNVLCTCDLYNEGVDLPFVDTLLLLRPTSSASLFVQQLGRGLRQHDDKSSCLVLDFIGQHRAEFRFDGPLSAMTGIGRARLPKAVQEGFPFLPAGCVLQLDSVVRDGILKSLRDAIASATRLVAEVRELAAEEGGALTLGRYLEATGRDPEDIYTKSAGGWTTLRRRAGLLGTVDEDLEDLSRRFGWLLHVDEPARLSTWTRAINDSAPIISPYERRRLAMLDFQLHHRGILRVAEDTVGYYTARPAIRDELVQLAAVLYERVALAADVEPVPGWPLALHRHYGRREIVAAVGFVKPGAKGKIPQGGILKLDDERRELLLVTLDKSSAGFSPTTRYRDYAISRSLFHWETQGNASVSRPSGRRYLESATNGWSFHLFVRTHDGAAYAYLGPVRYLRHEGDRPISITWALEHEMPAALYQQYATLAQG